MHEVRAGLEHNASRRKLEEILVNRTAEWLGGYYAEEYSCQN